MRRGAHQRTKRVEEVPRLFSAELEQACLGGVLLHPDQAEAIAALARPADFALPAHRHILQAILDLRQRGDEATVVSAADELARRGQLESCGDGQWSGPAYLTALVTACDYFVLAEQHARRIRDYARRRKVVQAAAQATRWAYDLGNERYLEQALAALQAPDLSEDPAAEECCCWTHRELLALEFQPAQWLVQRLIVQGGLVILAGRPKVGKSWMCLQLAIAVASCAPFLGLATCSGPVIYYALEDSARRLRERLQKQQAPADLDVTYYTRLSPLGGRGGGEAQLLRAIEEQAPALVIIDTLSSAMAPELDQNEAGWTGALLGGLRGLAQRTAASILVVLHHNKASAWRTTADVIHDVRGSGAIPAAADGILGLYRKIGEDEGKLLSIGRDAEDLTLAVKLDLEVTSAWQSLGEARLEARTEAEQEVYELLKELGQASASELARELGKARTTVRDTLTRLEGQGLVRTGIIPASYRKGKTVIFFPAQIVPSQSTLTSL